MSDPTATPLCENGMKPIRALGVKMFRVLTQSSSRRTNAIQQNPVPLAVVPSPRFSQSNCSMSATVLITCLIASTGWVTHREYLFSLAEDFRFHLAQVAAQLMHPQHH